jgi:LemA protein
MGEAGIDLSQTGSYDLRHVWSTAEFVTLPSCSLTGERSIMGWIILGLIVAVVLFVITIYNRLVAGRNRYKNAFAQIDVQLTRRHDLIPNLVETAKGYMAHERGTLEEVVNARNAAVSGLKAAAKDPTDPAAMKRLSEAEQGLSGALGRLFALSEAYPDLKANQNMMQLSEELTTTENKVAFARQAYNDSVMEYNTQRESFPDNLIADRFGFKGAELLEIENEAKREVPRVAF